MSPTRKNRCHVRSLRQCGGAESRRRTVRPRGLIVQVGLGAEMALPTNIVVTREIEVRGTFRFTSEFALAVDLMNQGRVDVKPLITAKVPFVEARSRSRSPAIAPDPRRYCWISVKRLGEGATLSVRRLRPRTGGKERFHPRWRTARRGSLCLSRNKCDAELPLVSPNGCAPQTKDHFAANLPVGADRAWLTDMMIQLSPFVGYPMHPQQPPRHQWSRVRPLSRRNPASRRWTAAAGTRRGCYCEQTWGTVSGGSMIDDLVGFGDLEPRPALVAGLSARLLA